ncbi:MAG: hypothetical protein PHQ34_10125 [Methanothrix sp.]|nr:hypothetical protein [Methanothrix sp.]
MIQLFAGAFSKASCSVDNLQQTKAETEEERPDQSRIPILRPMADGQGTSFIPFSE